MLTILLKILSIFGILLLAILAVLLVLILAVLFVPVTYKISASRSAADDGGGVLTRAAVKIGWFLNILRLRFVYPEPGKVVVKFLFFTIFSSGSDRAQEDGQTSNKTSRKTAPKAAEKTLSAAADKVTGTVDDDTTNTVDDDITGAADDNQTGAATDKTANQDVPEKKGFVKKIQYTFRSTYDKIKNIRENIAYYKEVLSCDDTKELLNYAFARIGKILKSIRPRKLRADIRFGTGSPDTTGYIYGIYGMLCSCLGKNVLLTPDFERAVLEGRFYAAGHITIIKLLWHGLPVVFDSRLKKLIDKLKKEERSNGK